jgi:hypothetical protein
MATPSLGMCFVVISALDLIDPVGYWWPHTYSTWNPTITSFNFSVSAQFTIFSIFLGPELPEPF